MLQKLNRFFASRRGIVVAGAAIGVLAPLLQKLGNPPNMGICVACFERDIAGALGLHRAAVVQYIRPEIIAFVLGSTVAALVFGEFKARAGSAPIVRFVLGMFAMIGALAFLGCPWRALLRLAGGCPGRQLFLAGEGDGDAAVFVLGMITGAAFAHNFDLAAKADSAVEGVLKVGGLATAGMAAVILGLAVCLAIGFTMRQHWPLTRWRSAL